MIRSASLGMRASRSPGRRLCARRSSSHTSLPYTLPWCSARRIAFLASSSASLAFAALMALCIVLKSRGSASPKRDPAGPRLRTSLAFGVSLDVFLPARPLEQPSDRSPAIGAVSSPTTVSGCSKTPSLRWSTRAAGNPKLPESTANPVRTAGVMTSPNNKETHPKPMAVAKETWPGKNQGCAWHAAAAGSSPGKPSAVIASARRTACMRAATRASCMIPVLISAKRYEGQYVTPVFWYHLALIMPRIGTALKVRRIQRPGRRLIGPHGFGCPAITNVIQEHVAAAACTALA
eukprot:scaffold106864_cov75-Phaeocystis_antarctica.AAC.3